MKYLQHVMLFLAFMAWIFVAGAQEIKPLTFDDVLKWNRITDKALSHDGELVAYKLEPWKGDPVLKVRAKDGSGLLNQKGGTDFEITEDSRYVVARVKPLEDTIRQLKLNDTKEDNLPMDQLLIFDAKSGEKELVDSLYSFKVPGKWSGWLAYQTTSEVQKKTAGQEAESQSFQGSEKTKKKSSENAYTLHVRKLPGASVQFPYVTDYVFAEEEEALAFVSTGDNKGFEAGVYFYDLSSQENIPVMQGKAEYKKLSFSKDGSILAFVSDSISSSDPSQGLSGRKKEEIFSLYVWDGQGKATEVVHSGDEAMPQAWTVSPYGNIRFSGSNERIFFGTAPIPRKKDTTQLEEEIPKLDVWHWNEPVLHSVQLNNRKENLKESYMAVYHRDRDQMVQLEKEDYTGIKWIDEGDGDHVLAWTYLPYGVRRMWEGSPYHRDFYLVDVKTGQAEMFKKNCRATPDVSPNGAYVYWYQALDTTWNTWHIKSGREYTITHPENVQCADELNDRPMPAYPYGTAGWLEDDEALLVYDRYDIWKVDPEDEQAPVNLTRNGRQTHTEYRLVDYRPEEEEEKALDPEKTYHLHGHNVNTRADGYYSMNLENPGKPERIIEGAYRLNRPIKAQKEDRYLFTKETFQRFPDLLITEDFEDPRRISQANPQQEDFKWGTVELYSWTSADGQKLDGLLVKPEDFDPDKKYPLIVNFYEKSSQGLYRHRVPEVDRSTIGYHYYTSNDYIIFNPDVYYETGYPGEDAFDCVITGVTQLISEGFIDKEHIAAQGHSWGGYQTAYLATRTDLFAAIESGAPVSNMFSAYGGIRGWSGRNRSFQYENTQSRIGESIWDAPLRYLENSPLFWADKIHTPLLIMHNEGDGAVPFSQGVEFFIALRRLRKPAWLLNYNEADHWPTKTRDKLDFQIRMSQFFDHYLKEKPMPEWMKKGIPAVDKGFDMGYELVE